MKRLSEQYTWGDIEQSTYRVGMDRLKARLAAMPSPLDSNLIAFDRTAGALLPFADVIRATTPEHQGAIIRHIVERVILGAGEVRDVHIRMEAAPFFAGIRDGMAVAPPEGFEPAIPERLDAYG